VSAWLKRHHPAAFAAALINSQPMGFYQPAQIVRDAKDHGVQVRPVDINESNWDCTLESPLPVSSTGRTPAPRQWGSSGPALRLGFRQIRGMQQVRAEELVCARNDSGRFTSVTDFHIRTALPVAVLRRLAEADAFGSLGLSRRQALWEVLRLKDEENPLFEGEGRGEGQRDKGTEGQRGGGRRDEAGRDKGTEGQRDKVGRGEGTKGLRDEASEKLFSTPFVPVSLRSSAPSVPLSLPRPLPPNEPPVSLPPMPLGQEVITDYSTAGLSLKQHPVALVREELSSRNILTSAQLMQTPHGRWVKVAGLVLIRQRPGTAAGIVFETLEDETGIVNLIVKPDIYDLYRPAARYAGLLQADGYVQRSGQIVHVMAKRLHDLSNLLHGYELRSRDFH
jgi:error-prone DNA polymerase